MGFKNPVYNVHSSLADDTTWLGLMAQGKAEAFYPADLGPVVYAPPVGRLMQGGGTNKCTDPQGTSTTFWGTATDITRTPNVAAAVSQLPHITKCIQYAFIYDGINTRIVETAKMDATASKTHFIGPIINSSGLVGAAICTLDAVVYSAAGAEVRTIALGVISTNTNWTRITSLLSTAASGEDKIALRLTFTGTDATDAITVQITGMHVVQEYFLSSVFDGHLLGCSFTGTVDASSSTRPGFTLSFAKSPITLPDPLVCTVAIQDTPLDSGPASYIYPVLFGILSSGAWRLYIASGGTPGWHVVVSDSSGYTNGASINTIYGGGVPRSFIARLGLTTIDLDIDGISATQTAHNKVPNAPETLQFPYSVGTEASYRGPLVITPAIWSTNDVSEFQANKTVLWANPTSLINWLRGKGYLPALIWPLQYDNAAYVVRT